MYRELFRKYEKNGINVVEVWMCSWWLALEWIHNAPGFNGVGHMNQYRAWLLDRIVELAEKHDIYLFLVMNNHGKFSTWCDKEWSKNPFNRENGGFLDSPEQFFSNARAKDAFRRYARYTVARWTYSPHVLAWKLFSEIDLTGEDSNFYKKTPMKKWHQEMASYLKNIDPYDHLVTTHWSTNYHKINPPIARIKNLDMLTTDAYARSTRKVMQLIRGTTSFASRFAKPAVVTEYGGSPYGDNLIVLRRQLHMGLWEGYFSQAAIPPMLWWFAFVDEYDLYHHFKALRHFMADENRQDMAARRRGVRGGNDLVMRLLQKKSRTLGWIMDRKHYYATSASSGPDVYSDAEAVITRIAPGDYTLQIWDTRLGIIRNSSSIHISADKSSNLTIELPPFKRDIAFKLIRQN